MVKALDEAIDYTANLTKELTWSEERFRAAINAVNGILWTNNAQGKMVGEQTGWASLTGQTLEEYQGYGWTKMVHPDDVKLTIEIWEKCLSTKDTFICEHRLKCHDNKWRRFSVRAIPILEENGDVREWVGVHTDITQEYKAQEELKASEQRLSLALEATQIGEWDLNLITHEVVRSIRHDEIFGYPKGKETWNYQDFVQFVHKDDLDRVDTEFENGVQNGSLEFECRIHRKNDNELRWIWVKGISYKALKGKAKKMTGLIIDITDRKENDEALEKAKFEAESSNLAKTDFLANMSHEIRTPMNAIVGLSNILIKDESLTSRQQHMIDTLKVSADTLMYLINDLLDLTKIESNKLDLEKIPFKLTDVISHVVSINQIKANDKSITLKNSIPREVYKEYIGDPTRIQQIILNLVSNAIKFTDKGEVHIDLELQENSNTDLDLIKINIKDTGTGIEKDKQNLVFEKFTQADTSINRSYGGSGLGLSIVTKLVKAMGGKISLESDFGKGSTFSIILPLVKSKNQMLTHDVVENVDIILDKKILLVEDYEPNIVVAGYVLEELGYEYDVARNGEEAIEKFNDFSGYSVVLMDVQMPKMSGLDATKAIRKSDKDNNQIPIIAMTANAMKEDEQKCLEAGMNAYLSKPLEFDKLRETIEKFTKA